MAVYKVPQDVEAEDKLIGPFGFRQFIYLLIAGGLGGLTFFLVRAPLPIPMFAIFSVPPAVFLVILALPLKKDQPMEIYLAAIVRFRFKPKQRIWRNGGLASHSTVVINAPATVQQNLVRDISQEQALDQLGQLSRVVDTHGWAAKGVDIPPEDNYSYARAANLTADAEDVLDENTEVSKSFDKLLNQQKEQSRQELMARMQGGEQASDEAAQPATNAAQPPQEEQKPAAAPTPAPREQQQQSSADQMASRRESAWGTMTLDTSAASGEQPRFNPYPSMHQQVLNPVDRLQPRTFRAPEADTQASVDLQDDSGQIEHPKQEQAQQQTAEQPPADDQTQPDNNDNNSMTQQLSPDIMRLANNNDLSIQTIANEAHRAERGKDDDEVVVELR